MFVAACYTVFYRAGLLYLFVRCCTVDTFQQLYYDEI